MASISIEDASGLVQDDKTEKDDARDQDTGKSLD